jgi:hypothetical protein
LPLTLIEEKEAAWAATAKDKLPATTPATTKREEIAAAETADFKMDLAFI